MQFWSRLSSEVLHWAPSRCNREVGSCEASLGEPWCATCLKVFEVSASQLPRGFEGVTHTYDEWCSGETCATDFEARDCFDLTDSSHKVYYEEESVVQTMAADLLTFTGLVIYSIGACCDCFCCLEAKLERRVCLVASKSKVGEFIHGWLLICSMVGLWSPL